MNLSPLVLRPATPSDFPFIWHLRRETMKGVVAASYGWVDDTQKTYAEESLQGQIVTFENQSIGVLTLSDWGDQIHIAWVAIDTAYQGKGYGTLLLRHAQQVAATAGKPMTLQVLKNNPASKLYLRCGFQVTDDSEPYRLYMRWLPEVH
jgi:ribosomal protein S18 acetylase RimI-like enzyme